MLTRQGFTVESGAAVVFIFAHAEKSKEGENCFSKKYPLWYACKATNFIQNCCKAIGTSIKDWIQGFKDLTQLNWR